MGFRPEQIHAISAVISSCRHNCAWPVDSGLPGSPAPRTALEPGLEPFPVREARVFGTKGAKRRSQRVSDGRPQCRRANVAATRSASGMRWLTHPWHLLTPASGNHVCRKARSGLEPRVKRHAKNMKMPNGGQLPQASLWQAVWATLPATGVHSGQK